MAAFLVGQLRDAVMATVYGRRVDGYQKMRRMVYAEYGRC